MQISRSSISGLGFELAAPTGNRSVHRRSLQQKAMSKSKKRKRTRANEEEGRQETENVGESKTVQASVKVVAEKPETKLSPIMAYFPSGYEPKKDPESEVHSSFKIYKSVNSRNLKNPRMQVVMGVPGSHVNFVGTNYSGEAMTPQLCNYALAVFDKDTSVLKMVPIAANRIYRLEPKLGVTAEVPIDELHDQATGEVSKNDKDNKVRKLQTMYSTKKDIRRDEKREAIRMTEDSAIPGDMDKKLGEIKINMEVVEDATSTTTSRNIPPYDIEATTADKAYPLEKIILKGEWEYLLDVFELAQTGSEANPEVYPSFVCNRLGKLKSMKDESKIKRMAGIMSYITHLIKYKDRHSMEGVSSAKHHKLPTIFSQKFSSLFGTRDAKRIPEEKQNLLVSYVLVLTLFVDRFFSDPSDIAKDLRMDPVALREHYDYLGCKHVRDNKVLMATLPIPLEFPTTKRRRRR